jgi:putative flippase GtrA
MVGDATKFVKFCAVGGSGYLVNMTVFTALVAGAGVHPLIAAICSFAVAVGNNYTWNRLWTFRENRGPVGIQGMRFLTVSLLALCANLAFLSVLTAAGVAEIPAQAAAIVMATPLGFLGNKVWTFGVPRPTPSLSPALARGVSASREA